MSINISDATSIGLPKIIDPTVDVPILSGEVVNIISNLPEDHALLIACKQGANRYLLDSDNILVGRLEEAEIFLDDASVSRKHASITRMGNVFYIEDIGSLNGTYVNKQLQDSKCLLNKGDEVQIGKYKFIFFPSPRQESKENSKSTLKSDVPKLESDGFKKNPYKAVSKSSDSDIRFKPTSKEF